MSPLGKETSAKKGFSLTFINDFEEEVIWWVAPLLSIQQLGATSNKPKAYFETTLTLICGVTSLGVKALIIRAYWSSIKLIKRHAIP